MTRYEFMDIVYNELHSDGDNCRANRIIDAADEYAEAVMKSVLDEIEAVIDTPNRGVCDYFIVDKIEEIINEYTAESEEGAEE